MQAEIIWWNLTPQIGKLGQKVCECLFFNLSYIKCIHGGWNSHSCVIRGGWEAVNIKGEDGRAER